MWLAFLAVCSYPVMLLIATVAAWVLLATGRHVGAFRVAVVGSVLAVLVHAREVQAEDAMASRDRATARELAQRHVAGGDPTGWFEVLYATSRADSSVIPWADLSPNPNLMSWLDERGAAPAGSRALKIGCGLGDDAEELSRRGFETTAFDISQTAISWCRERFPESSVRYVEADLLQPPDEWRHRFDFVLESYTLQVLPVALRAKAMRRAADFVAPGGTLLVITRGRELSEPEGPMPWPLSRHELEAFTEGGLVERDFEDYADNESPPVRRFRVTYTRGAVSAHSWCEKESGI